MPRLSSGHSRWRGQAPSTASRGAAQPRPWLGFRDPPGHCALSVQAHSCSPSQQPVQPLGQRWSPFDRWGQQAWKQWCLPQGCSSRAGGPGTQVS